MNTRPNIFNYAKKELTQDAMICWLLKCCHSTEEKYKKIGIDFIRFIFNDKTLSSKDIELETGSPHNQYYHMDVYANVRIRDKIYPVIFEDKTNTYLHGEQHLRYLNTVDSWKEQSWDKWKDGLFSEKNLKWGETIFVFYKIGYIFQWQRKELDEIAEKIKKDNAVLKIITLENMSDFIKKLENKDELLFDYSMFLKDKLTKNDGKEAKYDRYIGKIFFAGKRFNYSHQGWGDADFAFIKNKTEPDENGIYCSFRIEDRKNRDSDAYEPAIIMQQYRNEKCIIGNCEDIERLKKERLEIAEYSRDLCREIFEELGKADMLTMEYNDKNKMPNANSIFKLFINDDNEDEVCKLFYDFIREFTKKLQSRYPVINKITE